MASGIELHDSIIQGYLDSGGKVTVRVAPAILHRSEYRPGIDAGSVYRAAFDLVFQNGKFEVAFSRLPTSLWEGSVEVGNDCFDNLLPFPFELQGPVKLHCIEQNGNTAVIIGDSLSIRSVAEEIFVEDFPGS